MSSDPIFTIGHSNRPLQVFVALLRQVNVQMVVDVRAYPRSRANPQYNRDLLPQSLEEAAIGYEHLAALGGRRHARQDGRPSPNALWRHPAFRSYADYAGTAQFRSGLEALVALSKSHSCAFMCSEALWWRCHRRIVADYLLVRGIRVLHIMGEGKVVAAELTPGAEPLPDCTVTYPKSPEDPDTPS